MRRSVNSQPIKSEADGLGLTVRDRDGWEAPVPRSPQEGFDRIADGRAGVVLITSGDPAAPATGQIWLDTAATGTGSSVFTITTITTDLTLTVSHAMVFCDASAGPIVVTLPAAAGNGGRLYSIIKTDATTNPVTISGGDFDPLTCEDEAVPILSDGTNWRIPF